MHINNYLYNGHGDVIALTDETGQIVNSYSYDEWGNILNKQETISNPIRYGGEYFDEESGLYYLRARYYDPTIGRFISKDSVEGDINNPLSLNLYTYCGNNPINRVDPSGLSDVGLRSFAYSNGYSISWNSATRTATISRGSELMRYTDGVGGTYIDSGGNMIVNSDFLPNASSLPYTAGDKAAGVKMAVIDSKQYLDISTPVNNALNRDRREFAEHAENYGWFAKTVGDEGKWNIKRNATTWERTIGTTFPGYDQKMLLFGQFVTVEQVGNITYGYLGGACGFGIKTLIGGSQANHFGNHGVYGWNNEFADDNYIIQGFNWFSGVNQ